MSPQQWQELWQHLDAIGAKLQVGSQALWSILTRQAKVDLALDLLQLPLLMALCFVAKYLWFKWHPEWLAWNKAGHEHYESWPMEMTVRAWMAWLCLMVSTFWAGMWVFGVFPQVLTILFNPQYYVLQSLLQSVK